MSYRSKLISIKADDIIDLTRKIYSQAKNKSKILSIFCFIILEALNIVGDCNLHFITATSAFASDNNYNSLHTNSSHSRLLRIKKEAENVATSSHKNMLGTFSSDISNHPLKDHMGYSHKSINNTNLNLNQNELDGLKALNGADKDRGSRNGKNSADDTGLKCNSEKCEVGDLFDSRATNERIDNLDKIGFGVNSNNGYLDKMLAHSKNAKDDKSLLSGNTQICTKADEKIATNKLDTCDEYFDRSVGSCISPQIVEIDARYKYNCQKTREIREKICNDIIKDIKCSDDEHSEAGGIVAESVEADMKFSFDNGILTIGTVADDYWRGYCTIFDRVTSFKIANRDKLEEFTLIQTGYDDYIQIEINNHTVYVGPDGGTHLEVRGDKVYNGKNYNKCERGVNRNISLNINLLPYLKEGLNVVKTRVIVSGHGEGWLKIKTKAQCTNWSIVREETCTYI